MRSVPPSAPRASSARRRGIRSFSRLRNTATGGNHSRPHRLRPYLLDEPTAQLDPANEDQLRHAIHARDGRTVIVAAHRLSTVMDADRIVVMVDGGVQAVGTHAELVATNALYASMARAQRLSART